ncbi:mannonate dehydratase [Salibacterium halotolerans]|uniref:Mannonate dehydratase n=1 Tax=Salibacterium halotolerans TaxID=1884432 RepID=A0A1I5RPC4_9BACI|nr:mannonate dehydratase [Salibacterium halotolerans]SFP60404.1 mannonate dehydratase [Salibacterium halotolerans]
MNMIFRWYGEDNDSVLLNDINQIPGTGGAAWALHEKQPGEIWEKEKIEQTVDLIHSHGLHAEVVESVNVHEDIKLGLPSRETYIDNYVETIRNLAASGVKVICYNFMPVFDWIRTDLHKELGDGSTALFYENSQIENITPEELIQKITENPEFTMPGWEPGRLEHIQGLIDQYKDITAEDLWGNLQYFLERVIPVCKECDVRMAIHPDDPPWSVFGLPRIITGRNDLKRLTALVESGYNGITLCSGALGAHPDNDIPAMIHEFHDRIHFAHVRNVRRFHNGDFIETSHRAGDGSVDIVEVIQAYHDIGYTGYIRPDHGRHLWGENCRPGYGLYDRALGIMYMLGIWDHLEKGGTLK